MEQSSNKSKDLKRQAEVVVIGSGISGLWAAYSLHKKGINVIVLEAADYIGGRMKQLKGWVDWKTIDLGAEFIHGAEGIMNDLIDKNGWPNRSLFTWAQGDGEHPLELAGKEYSMYYLGNEKKLLPYDTKDPSILKLNELLFGLSDLEVSPDDKRTLEQYLRENGIDDRGIALADAGYSNSLCAFSGKMSLYETVQINIEWDRFGHGDFRLENSNSQMLDHLTEGLDVRRNWIVQEINYEKPVVCIKSRSGETVYTNRVIVTVPLNILKEGSIRFTPSLPAKKLKAIDNLKMDNAIKVVLTFSERFWPSRLNGVVCADSLIPEIWFEHFDRIGQLTKHSKSEHHTRKRPEKETYIISAFATSEFAKRAMALPEKELIKRILQQLDDMFVNNEAFKLFGHAEAHPKTNVPNPATKYFVDYKVQDWEKEPFIKGGYTHPALTANKQVREDLAEPLDNRVFWAGEATHPKAYMTMHGAIETGDFVAKRVYEAVKSSPSNASSKL